MAGRMKALGQVTLNQAHSLRTGRTPQPFLVHRHVQSTIIRHRNNTPVVTIHQAIQRDKIIPTLTALQQDGLETERDIQMAPNMTLPALSNDKYSNVGKVMIETRHLLHEGTVINRWHGEKTKNVPPPTIAGNVEQEECKMTEVERQIKVREEMENEYCKNVDEIRNDMDQDESSNDDTDEIKHEDEMNVDTDVECVVSDTKVDIDWNKKTQKVLKKLCRDKGLKVSGNKSKLIERLKDPTNDKHKSNRKPMNE
eukprot:541453_1